jgi:xanthine dehydrogenase small subunit
MEWRTVTSCTLAMGELDGRHVITIEGLSAAGLTPVMAAMLDEGASQCGFCSPGFVLALTGFLVSGARIDPVAAMMAVEGNLCRCTGYGSIRRAAARLAAEFADLPSDMADRLCVLADRQVLPAGLAALMTSPVQPAATGSASGSNLWLGGGTDYFVRNPDPEPDIDPQFVGSGLAARSITSAMVDGIAVLRLGAAVNASDFFHSKLVDTTVPGMARFECEVASPPIRNRATLTGNIANASPIADMTAMLIALDARLEIAGGPLVAASPGTTNPAASPATDKATDTECADQCRLVALPDFFKGYKQVDLAPGEWIAGIIMPAAPVRFNFEKAAKRARLDIATVNTAMAVTMQADGSIATARYAAGGIAPVPLRLRDVEAALIGQRPSANLARTIGQLAAAAGAPISDVRGSAAYRRRLMQRLAWAHFIRLWPELQLDEELLS